MEDPQKLPLSSTREAVEWVEQERRKFHTLYQEKIDEFEQAFQENMDWLKDYYNNITNKQQEPVVTRVLKTPSARRRRGQNPRTQIKGLFENPPIPEESVDSNLLKPNGQQVDLPNVARASNIEVVIPKSRLSFDDQESTTNKPLQSANPLEDEDVGQNDEQPEQQPDDADQSENEEVVDPIASREESPPKAPAIQFPTLSSMKSKSAENSIMEEISEYPSGDESFESLAAKGIITSTPAVDRHPVSDDSDIESLVTIDPSPSGAKRYPADEESFDFSAVGTKRIKLAEMKDMPESMSEMESTEQAQMDIELEETSVVEPIVQEPAQPEPMTIDEPSKPVMSQARVSSCDSSPQSKESSRSDMGSPEPLLKRTKENDSPGANPVSQEDRLKAIFSTGSEKLKQALQSLRSNSSASRASKSMTPDKKNTSVLREELSSLLENTQYSVNENEQSLPEEAITLATQILGPEYADEIKNLSFESSHVSSHKPEDSNVETIPHSPQDATSVKLESDISAAIATSINEEPEILDQHHEGPKSPPFKAVPLNAAMKSPFIKNKLLNNVGEFSMIDDGDESFMQIMNDLKKIQDSLGDDEDEDIVNEDCDFDGSISDVPVENLTFKQLQEEQRRKMLDQKEEEEDPEAENEEDEIIEHEELQAIAESEPEPEPEPEPESQDQQEVEDEQPKKLLKAKSTKGKPIIKSLAAAAAAARKQQEQEEKRAAKAKEMEAKRKGLKAHESKPLPQPPKRTLRSKAKETATQSETKLKASAAAPAPEKGKLSVFKKLAQAKNSAVSSTSTKKTVVSTTTATKPLPKIPNGGPVPPLKRPLKTAETTVPFREEEAGSDVENENQNYNELEGLDKFLDPLTPEKKSKAVVTTTTTTFESIAIEQNGKIQLPEIPSDESDSEYDKPEVPDWAQSPNLKRALMEQSKINPEAIFGKIPAVNMEELFGRKSSRYKLRQSSVWQGVDKLTHQEEIEYEKRMGWRS